MITWRLQDLNSGANAGIAKEGWSFIAVMKKDSKVSLWLGGSGANDVPEKVGEMTLPSTAQYVAKVCLFTSRTSACSIERSSIERSTAP